jgi:hypothetical protein
MMGERRDLSLDILCNIDRERSLGSGICLVPAFARDDNKATDREGSLDLPSI